MEHNIDHTYISVLFAGLNSAWDIDTILIIVQPLLKILLYVGHLCTQYNLIPLVSVIDGYQGAFIIIDCN